MTQFARPDGTISSGSFFATGAGSIHEAIDEDTLDISDFAQSSAITNPLLFEVSIGNPGDPGIHTGHEIRITAKTAIDAEFAVVSLMQGAILIQAGSFLVPQFAPTEFVMILSEANAALITNYPDLSIRFDPSLGVAQAWFVYQAFMQLPDEITAPVGDADITGPALQMSSTGTRTAPAVAGDTDLTGPALQVTATASQDVDAREGTFDNFGPALQASATGLSTAIPSVIGLGDIVALIPGVSITATQDVVNVGDADISLPMATVDADGNLTIDGAAVVGWTEDDPNSAAFVEDSGITPVWTEDEPSTGWS